MLYSERIKKGLCIDMSVKPSKMTDYFNKTPIRSASLNRLDKRMRSPDIEEREDKNTKVTKRCSKCFSR